MLNFTKEVFRGFMEVFLWLNLVGCAIGGGVLGYVRDEEVVYAIIGVILGVIIGIITNVLWGGFVAVILNIDSNLEMLTGKYVENEDVAKPVTSDEKMKELREKYKGYSDQVILDVYRGRSKGGYTPEAIKVMAEEIARRGLSAE